MSGSATGVAIAILAFAAYMFVLSRRSATGSMGRGGPGIRIAETTRCEHTWQVAQQIAAPIYRIIALSLGALAVATFALGFVSGTVAIVIAAVVGIGIEVFFLGVASVRSRKAAAEVHCEHAPPVRRGRNRKQAAAPQSTYSPANRRRKKRR